MTAVAPQHAVDEMKARLRRVYLLLLTLLAVGVGSLLGVFVTPHLGKILATLATLALLGLLAVVVRNFFRDAAAEEADEATPPIATPPTPVMLRVVDEAITTSAPRRRSSTATVGADIERGHAPVAQLHAPRVQLLGPVQVINPRGVTPSSEAGMKQWKSQILRATELVAYLVTHRGAKTKAVHEAMWGVGSDVSKGTQSRNKLTNSTRRWLGNDAQGREYFPDAWGGVYELHESVRSDWDDWCELVGDRPAETSTANLVRALELVKGQPFSDVKDRYYAWAMNELKPTMVAAIADAAHELATRALHGGEIRHARFAAAKGCMVEPENETHWRNALRAERLAGDRAGIERLVVQLELAMKQMGLRTEDLEPETRELIIRLRGRAA